MQEEFTLFPEFDSETASEATRHWMEWLSAPDVAIDENAYDNLIDNIGSMFLNENGTFLAPNEVEDNLNAIFEFRQQAGANDNEAI